MRVALFVPAYDSVAAPRLTVRVRAHGGARGTALVAVLCCADAVEFAMRVTACAYQHTSFTALREQSTARGRRARSRHSRVAPFRAAHNSIPAKGLAIGVRSDVSARWTALVACNTSCDRHVRALRAALLRAPDYLVLGARVAIVALVRPRARQRDTLWFALLRPADNAVTAAWRAVLVGSMVATRGTATISVGANDDLTHFATCVARSCGPDQFHVKARSR